MSFSVIIGLCDACASAAANYEVGSRTCESCGAAFEKLCAPCAQKPCPRCNGQLVRTAEVFPHPLFRAISEGDQAKVRQLVGGRSLDLNEVTNREGETPLHVAARAKGKGIAASLCKDLLRLGMSSRARGSDGRAALMEMVRLRVFNKDVALLLQLSINDQDNYGRTALMFAAQHAGGFGSRKGNLSIARELLSLRADPLICDQEGRTALGYAITSNDTERNEDMIEFLKKAMLTETARRDFEARNSYHFDRSGKIHFTPRKR